MTICVGRVAELAMMQHLAKALQLLSRLQAQQMTTSQLQGGGAFSFLPLLVLH